MAVTVRYLFQASALFSETTQILWQIGVEIQRTADEGRGIAGKSNGLRESGGRPTVNPCLSGALGSLLGGHRPGVLAHGGENEGIGHLFQ